MAVVKGPDGLYHRVPNKEVLPEQLSGGGELTPIAEFIPEEIPPKAEGCDCTNCPMKHRASCLPERVGKADIVFVGEGPGYNEIRNQEFFIGRAGQLLHAGMEQVDLESVPYILNNATLCDPGGDFNSKALWCCRERLIRELYECEPKIIVPVGAQALSSLAGEERGITEAQGRVFDYQLGTIVPEYLDEYEECFDFEGYHHDSYQFEPNMVKMVPCFHSAYVLRNTSAFYDFMNALLKVSMVVKGDALASVQPEAFNTHIANADNVLELLQQVVSYDHVYADLETTGFSPYHDAIICISIAGRNEGEDIVGMAVTFDWSLFEDNSAAFGLLIKTLEQRSVGYWNGMFDCQFLREYGIDALVGEDIMLKQYTLDERPMSQGLKSTAQKRLSAPEWEAPLKQYVTTKVDSYINVPYDILAQYAAYDTCYTGTLDPLLSREMEEHNEWVYRNILIPATNMFIQVIKTGLPVDVTQLESLHEEFGERLQELLENLRESTGDEGFNPSSVRDAKYLCYELLNLPVKGKDKGSTARTVIEPYRDAYDEVAWLLDFRSTRKMIGTYLEGIMDELDEESIWHPNIRVNGTVTGRLASGKGKTERSRKAVNALGVPKEKGGIKKLVHAPEGKLVLEGDGSQMELRTLGALANDRQMIADFLSGRDFHGIIRNRMFGRGYEKSNYTHQEVLDAKTVAFGPPYGRSAESIAMALHCTVSEAREFLELIWGPYPDAIAWLEARVDELKETGEIRSYYGRVRHWGLITPDNIDSASKEGRNFGVQSAATDTNLIIMVGIHNEFSKDFIEPIIPTHDAILAYVDAERHEEARLAFKEYAERRAQELLKTDMPFVYDVNVGDSWGDV